MPTLYFEVDGDEPCPVAFGGASDVLVYFLSLVFATRYGSQHDLSKLALLLRNRWAVWSYGISFVGAVLSLGYQESDPVYQGGERPFSNLALSSANPGSLGVAGSSTTTARLPRSHRQQF